MDPATGPIRRASKPSAHVTTARVRNRVDTPADAGGGARSASGRARRDGQRRAIAKRHRACRRQPVTAVQGVVGPFVVGD